MKKYNFNTAYTQIYDLYGLTLEPDDFQNIGLLAWEKIGIKDSKLLLGTFEVDIDDNSVQIPCFVDEIIAVTSNESDASQVTQTSGLYNLQGNYIQEYVEGRNTNRDNYNIRGKLVKYVQEGNRIVLNKKYEKVNILYKGLLLDDEDMPFINSKQISAIACYCAYAIIFKRGLSTGNQADIQMSQILFQQWNQLCSTARVPDQINQNSMDKILDSKMSYDRKRFGKSYKPNR